MLAVPVTKRLDVVAPPKKVTDDVAVPPRAVTLANVSELAGQLVPLVKQTFWPATVNEVNEALVPHTAEAKRFRPVAFEN